jgi:16S rRNA (guanine966-N2)-methyltransferase
MNPRIITGSAKGQRLEVPERGCRPMTDRTKSALFSIISERIYQAEVLDLYAGTGALGLECLSRGAKRVVFVDRSVDAVHCIKRNADKIGVTSLIKIIKASTSRLLDEYKKFEMKEHSFDIIFFTPPYDDFKEKTLEKTAISVKKDGIIAVEHGETRKAKERVGDLLKIDSRKYGGTILDFYQWEPQSTTGV